MEMMNEYPFPYQIEKILRYVPHTVRFSPLNSQGLLNIGSPLSPYFMLTHSYQAFLIISQINDLYPNLYSEGDCVEPKLRYFQFIGPFLSLQLLLNFVSCYMTINFIQYLLLKISCVRL